MVPARAPSCPRRTAAFALIALGWVLGSPAQALQPSMQVSQYRHEVWDGDRGLPQNSVFAFTRTPDGYLWAGTAEGLVRFDGERFTVWDRKNTPAFRLNGVSSLALDGSGALWIGTEEGLLVRRNGEISRVAEPSLDRAHINALRLTHDGTLWIATNGGLFSLEHGHLQAHSEGLPAEAVYALFEDRSGTLWIGTRLGLARRQAGALLPALPGLEPKAVLAFEQTGDGSILIASGNRLYRFHAEQLDVLLDRETLPEGTMALHADRHGNLWIGAEAGVFRFSDGVLVPLTSATHATNDGAFSFFEDRDGALWIGGASTGIHRLSDPAVSPLGAPEGLTAEMTFPILEDTHGTMWIGTAEGLHRVEGGRAHKVGPAEGLPSVLIRTLAIGTGGELWVGTSEGVYVRQGQGFRHLGAAQGLPAPTVLALSGDSSGNMWIATPLGLVRWVQSAAEVIGADQGLPNGIVHRLIEDVHGALWVGAASGLYRLSGGRAQKVWPANGESEAVLDVHFDPTGAIWLGTLRGLVLLQGAKQTRFTEREGMFNQSVFRILPDASGGLWMSCNEGIFRMDRAELLAIAAGTRSSTTPLVLSRADGMRAVECNGTAQPSGSVARDGRLWFPTIRGVAIVDPERALHRPQVTPQPRIEEVTAGGNVLDPARLVASPDARTLAFHFTAIAFGRTEAIRFRYRLSGVDGQWIDAKSREAVYAHLPPGHYRFEVQAAFVNGAHGDGIAFDGIAFDGIAFDGIAFEGEPAAVEVTLEPRWTETIWFYLAAALLAGGVIGGGFWVRVSSLKRRQAWLEARVTERTGQLAKANSELDENLQALRNAQAQLVEAGKLAAVGTLAAGVGHEINNPLAYIVSNLGYVRDELRGLVRRGEAPAKPVEELEQALEESLEGADKVRRIVQDLKTFSRGDEDELGPVELHAVIESAAKMASGEIRHRARLVKELQAPVRVHGNSARLGQVFLNLLVNAAHALPDGGAATHQITLRTRAEGGWVIAEVEDTGSGIPEAILGRIFEPFFTTKPVGVGTGLGLALCRTYVTAMGGQIEVASQPGKGSTFRLKLRPSQDLARTDAATGATPASGPRRRVLIVDDDALVIAGIRRMLGSDHDVVSSVSPRSALEVLTGPTMDFDLVLCDLMMPDLTGMDLHRELSRLHPERAARLVFMSGGAFTDRARSFLEEIENAFVQKPFDAAQLQRMVAQQEP